MEQDNGSKVDGAGNVRVQRLVRRPYPAWVCSMCGAKYGRRRICAVSSWHSGTCGICGHEASVTEPRDFGHLQDDWEDRSAKDREDTLDRNLFLHEMDRA